MTATYYYIPVAQEENQTPTLKHGDNINRRKTYLLTLLFVSAITQGSFGPTLVRKDPRVIAETYHHSNSN
jgi:hypothetical protein